MVRKKTHKQIAAEHYERQLYCQQDSMISLNRGFVQHLVKILKGTIEGDQLENALTKERERIKAKQFENIFDRPFIS